LTFTNILPLEESPHPEPQSEGMQRYKAVDCISLQSYVIWGNQKQYVKTLLEITVGSSLICLVYTARLVPVGRLESKVKLKLACFLSLLLDDDQFKSALNNPYSAEKKKIKM